MTNGPLCHIFVGVEFGSIRHKALRRFVETGQPRGLPAAIVPRLDNIVAYLVAMAGEHELPVPPNFGAHRLTGDRAGRWSLVVTRNWRLTFRIVEGSIEDMDLEDYH